MHTMAMLFGHLRTLYSVYSRYPLWLQAYSTTLGLGVTYLFAELGRIALEKRRVHKEVARRNKRMKLEERKIRIQMSRMKSEGIRSLMAENDKLKADKATLQAEIRKKDIRMVMLQMKKRGLKQKIRKYEDRESFMEAVGLLQSKKNA